MTDTKWRNASHIDKLDDIANKYNNTYSAIKVKPVDVKSNTQLTLVKK